MVPNLPEKERKCITITNKERSTWQLVIYKCTRTITSGSVDGLLTSYNVEHFIYNYCFRAVMTLSQWCLLANNEKKPPEARSVKKLT